MGRCVLNVFGGGSVGSWEGYRSSVLRPARLRSPGQQRAMIPMHVNLNVLPYTVSFIPGMQGGYWDGPIDAEGGSLPSFIG